MKSAELAGYEKVLWSVIPGNNQNPPVFIYMVYFVGFPICKLCNH